MTLSYDATLSVTAGTGTIAAQSSGDGTMVGGLFTAPGVAETDTITATYGTITNTATVTVATASNPSGHWSIPTVDTIDGTISSTIGSYSGTTAWASNAWAWAGQPGDAVDYRLSGTMAMTATWVADDPDTVSMPPSQTYFGISSSAEWTNEPDGDTWPFTITVSGAGTDIEPFPGYAIPYWQMTQKSTVELVDTSSGSHTFTSDTLSAAVSGTCFGTPGLVPPDFTGTQGGFTYGVGVIPTPSVAITNPTANEMLTDGASITLQGTADATMGSLGLDTVQFNVDGTAVGAPVDFDPAHPTATYSCGTPWVVTAGKHTFTLAANYAEPSGGDIGVDSAGVVAYDAVVTVSTGNVWQPDPAVVGDIIYGNVSATTSGGLDSDGSGPTFVTYHWVTFGVWMSPDGGVATAFSPHRSGSAIGWIDLGDPTTQFDAIFPDAGYYILEVTCTATIHDSSTGAVIGVVSAPGFVGGTAGDLPDGGLTPNVRLRAHFGTPPTADGMELDSPPIGGPFKNTVNKAFGAGEMDVLLLGPLDSDPQQTATYTRASGQLPGTTYKWSITKGATKAVISGSSSAESVVLTPVAKSSADGDITLMLTYTHGGKSISSTNSLSVHVANKPYSQRTIGGLTKYSGLLSAYTGPFAETYRRVYPNLPDGKVWIWGRQVTYTAMSQLGRLLPNIQWLETINGTAKLPGAPTKSGSAVLIDDQATLQHTPWLNDDTIIESTVIQSVAIGGYTLWPKTTIIKTEKPWIYIR